MEASNAIAIPAADVRFESQVLRAGEPVYRVAIDNVGATEFAGCDGPTRRFGPFMSSQRCVSTLYAASCVEAALMEVVFHDVDLLLAEPTVYLTDIRRHRRSVVSAQRDLRLANLDDKALARLRVKRSELIDTLPTAYPHTVKWAKAAHASSEKFDGLRWNSRRSGKALAYVFFGDRVDRKADLDVTASPIGLLEGEGYETVMSTATVLGITVVH